MAIAKKDINTAHFAHALISAEAAMAEVRAAAEYLSGAMQRIHGGNWRIQIEHEDLFVMIARRRDRQPISPKRGEAV